MKFVAKVLCTVLFVMFLALFIPLCLRYSHRKTQLSNGFSDTMTMPLASVKSSTVQIEESKENIYNIMNTKPINFLSNFKNPCWYGNKTNGPLNDNKLHCLPYFYVIGMMKSCTTDLFGRINNHPEVESAGFKEAYWFQNKRFGLRGGNPLPTELETILKTKDVQRLEYYVTMFDIGAKNIAKHPSKSKHNINYYNHITGEGTPGNLHRNRYWDMLPGNVGLLEPRYTILHYIKHLVPDAKILIILRDPVDRLVSDYLHTAVREKIPISNLSQDTLHERVKYEVEMYGKCFQKYSMRRCIYDTRLHNYTEEMLRNIGGFEFSLSFHAFYMKELLSVFSKDQILPILMLDYIHDRHGTMMKVFDFLGLSKPAPKYMQRIMTNKIRNSKPNRKLEFGKMRADTKQLLREFLKPFNEQMSKLMNDSRYLFTPNGS